MARLATSPGTSALQRRHMEHGTRRHADGGCLGCRVQSFQARLEQSNESLIKCFTQDQLPPFHPRTDIVGFKLEPRAFSSGFARQNPPCFWIEHFPTFRGAGCGAIPFLVFPIPNSMFGGVLTLPHLALLPTTLICCWKGNIQSLQKGKSARRAVKSMSKPTGPGFEARASSKALSPRGECRSSSPSPTS